MLKVGRERWNNLINCMRALRPVDASDHSQGCEGLVNPIYSIVLGQGLDHNSSSTGNPACGHHVNQVLSNLI